MSQPQSVNRTVPGVPTITRIEVQTLQPRVVVLHPRPRTLEHLRDEDWLRDWAVTGA